MPMMSRLFSYFRTLEILSSVSSDAGSIETTEVEGGVTDNTNNAARQHAGAEEEIDGMPIDDSTGGQKNVSDEEAGVVGEQDLTAELESARAEAKETYDRMLRLAAEFENFKKRMERERQSALKFAEENIVRELLPSIDNLDRALEQGQQTNDITTVLEGVTMTRDGIVACLNKVGVTALQSIGAAFDPNFHEALAMEENNEVPANHIIQEYQKGYMFKERLLRAAKVVVSSGTKKN